MRSVDLLAEMRAARRGLSAAHRDELIAAGVPADIVRLYPLIGAALVHVKGDLYRPDAGGKPAFITPVLVGDPVSPECVAPLVHARHLGDVVDLVAWHPDHPGRWALRCGAAAWLGCIEPQYVGTEPVRVRRSPLAWLRAGCDGLVVLSQDPADAWRVLSMCQVIAPEDAEHAAELRRELRRPWRLPRIAVSYAA